MPSTENFIQTLLQQLEGKYASAGTNTQMKRAASGLANGILKLVSFHAKEKPKKSFIIDTQLTLLIAFSTDQTPEELASLLSQYFDYDTSIFTIEVITTLRTTNTVSVTETIPALLEEIDSHYALASTNAQAWQASTKFVNQLFQKLTTRKIVNELFQKLDKHFVTPLRFPITTLHLNTLMIITGHLWPDKRILCSELAILLQQSFAHPILLQPFTYVMRSIERARNNHQREQQARIFEQLHQLEELTATAHHSSTNHNAASKLASDLLTFSPIQYYFPITANQTQQLMTFGQGTWRKQQLLCDRIMQCFDNTDFLRHMGSINVAKITMYQNAHEIKSKRFADDQQHLFGIEIEKFRVPKPLESEHTNTSFSQIHQPTALRNITSMVENLSLDAATLLNIKAPQQVGGL